MTPSVEDLKRLPLRGIVAYAVRWAERVRPALRPSQQTIDDERQRAVDAAIAAAKAFAEGIDEPKDPREAMPMAQKAKAMAMEAVSAADPADNSHVRYAARTAALAAETLAQALCAFAPASPQQADDVIELEDPLAMAIDGAAMMAHSTAYSARCVLRECGFEEGAADDYATLMEQFALQTDRIGAPLDVAAVGPLWRGTAPEWPGGRKGA